jgi:hypothetical protein
MNVPKLRRQAIPFLSLFLSLTLFLSMADSVLAESSAKDEGTTITKDGQLRTSDLPKPLQELGDAIQRVGNEVSKGVSKASKTLREAPEKMEKSKTKEK